MAGVGQKGSVKNVADGYALNMLIPNRMAEAATSEKLKMIEKQMAEKRAANATREKEWSEIVKKIDGKTLQLKANASQQGYLYEKISSSQIERAIEREWHMHVPADSISPKMAIKQAGEWPVEIRLGNHKATMTISVIS
ncbi:50S ribosomal protein L9 [Candidatus Kaiserbacteria bacterium RIFCSPLOWO2_01_FULL_53_17]|uniref:Large ribosomal subunit protein bL9 n=1 Tax=Candidatus Kaiserbacteria bacterium RIFCSPLOWO2_01_FULL_53_17 TaxID=1798511 RepID=A0A1F6EHK3_9BACT|nr:MAG: 50S ribosomal protein L9 [Candidatus Kaiserbacteria bacterium RIFCSPLOWO2_01_FULL_53_17]